MCRLIDDIIHFLESSGFICSRQIRSGYDVICTKAAGSGKPMTILPLEIKAATAEEAASEGERAGECVEFIRNIEGYPLIITEDRWKSGNKMMKERLLAHLEIFSTAYARNCEIRRIEKAEAENFLSANHSYGYAACRYRYGMYLKRNTGHLSTLSGIEPGTLVAVSTFSNARRWTKGDKTVSSYEWTRYATLPGLRLSGGMGRMLKAFISEAGPDDIMSYADLEWSEGLAYKELGFSQEDRKSPVTFLVDTENWIRTDIRKSCCETASATTETDKRYFTNFGSNKYRLKLTDYE